MTIRHASTHQGTTLSDPRWNNPACDNLKLDIIFRAWGYTPPDWLTFDVSGADISEILRNAAEIEKLFFPVRPPPHGNITWTRGAMNKEGHLDNYAWMHVMEPQKLQMFITVDQVEYRLLSYGKSGVKRGTPRVMGLDSVTPVSMNLEKLWGPGREERVYLKGESCIERRTVISTLPAPPRL